jgi:hypothetical protein
MSEGTSQGPAARDPRYKSEIVRLPNTPLYVRLESGPDLEAAWLCIEDGEPDMHDLATFPNHQCAHVFITAMMARG